MSLGELKNNSLRSERVILKDRASIMATDGTDFLSFTGVIQQVTLTLVNPYSSKSVDVDDEFRVKNGSYDGGAGTDFLLLSNDGDFLSVTDNTGIRVVRNVEQFIAGNGGDVINLADSDIILGDVTILGGAGDDILWANVGNDTVQGASGNDIIDGGPGNDRLDGNDDNDQIFGGEGDDFLNGGAGDDILYGGTDLGLRDLDKDFDDNITFPELQSGRDIRDLIEPGSDSLGINADNLSVDYEASATITFRDGFAGYKNTLAIYSVGEDGTIDNVEILWANIKTAGLNTEHQIDIPTGADGGAFGFFIIANGFRVNGSYSGLDIEGEGNVQLIYDFGGAGERLANINDDGDMISTVYNDGTTIEVLSGPVYHTTPRGGDNSINPDDQTHVVSGQAIDGNEEVLRVGFEDLPNLGDADFEDVLFDLDINEIRIDASETGSDILIGGAGNDILYGEGGDDILVVGQDFDQIHGGTGSDQIVFLTFDTIADQIHGFDIGVDGDTLNITDIIIGFDPLTNALTDFIQLTDGGLDVNIQIDRDGAGTDHDFVTIAVFDGGLDATLGDLIDNGQIVADNSVAF